MRRTVLENGRGTSCDVVAVTALKVVTNIFVKLTNITVVHAVKSVPIR